jgi:hypothetical protein
MSMAARLSPGQKSVLVIAAVALSVVVMVGYFLRPQAEPDSLNVPLGVEQAAIVTYGGPPIAVTPYKWGVAVNVRIAAVTEQPGARVYDVRYIVNRGGVFDLKDYLEAADGARLESLPSFKFHGDPKLSKELDARIQETEEIRVDVGGHYSATLAALGLLWLIWLLLLIFWRRPKRPPAMAPEAPAPTLAEQLRATLAELESGALDAAGKARLEMLFLRHWREELALAGQPMREALEAMARSDKTGKSLRRLQQWLHRREFPLDRAELAAALSTSIFDPPPTASAGQP